MPNRQPSRLIGHNHWETTNPDEAMVVLSEHNRKFRHEVETAKGYLMSSNTETLEYLMFNSYWTPAPQKAWTEADERHYLCFFWNKGWSDYHTFGRQGTVGAGEGLLLSPYHPLYWRSKEPRDVVGVRIPSKMLLDEAANLAGRPLDKPLEPEGMLLKRGPIWRLIHRFLGYLESGRFRKSSLLCQERERELVTDVVLGAPHNVPLREERAHNRSPFHKLRLDRAKEFMKAHLMEAMTLGDVAAAIGASAKSVYRAFRYSDQSWRVERWKMRMEQARRLLLAPEDHTTVNSVAHLMGFHPGRFPKQYFHLFGEYPSETLFLGRMGRKIY